MIVTMVFHFTDVVVILKLADVDPAVITTLAGTEAFDGLLLIIVTTTPPAGAGPVRLTVPTDVEPPAITEGVSVTDERITVIAGFTVMIVDLFTPEKLAVMLPAVGEATASELIVKFADVRFTGIVTDAATIAAGLALERATAAPPAGAGPVSVTVPVAGCPR